MLPKFVRAIFVLHYVRHRNSNKYKNYKGYHVVASFGFWYLFVLQTEDKNCSRRITVLMTS